MRRTGPTVAWSLLSMAADMAYLLNLWLLLDTIKGSTAQPGCMAAASSPVDGNQSETSTSPSSSME
jgi:hypothetical protein